MSQIRSKRIYVVDEPGGDAGLTAHAPDGALMKSVTRAAGDAQALNETADRGRKARSFARR